MTSLSDEDAANEAMNQDTATPVFANANEIYRQRFKGQKKVVERIDVQSSKNGETKYDVYIGSAKKANLKRTGEVIEGVPTTMTKKEILKYPLGAMNLKLEMALKARSEMKEKETKRMSGGGGGGGSSRKNKKKERRAISVYSSDEEFIVPDGVIDPPTRRTKQKRKNEKSESSSDSEEEEVPIVASKRGRGRPPKKKPVEIPRPKRKETPSMKEEKKTKTTHKKSSKRIEEREEDDDEIQVISPPKTGKQRSGTWNSLVEMAGGNGGRGEEKKKNPLGKYKIQSSSDDDDDYMKRVAKTVKEFEGNETEETPLRGKQTEKHEKRKIYDEGKKKRNKEEVEGMEVRREEKRSTSKRNEIPIKKAMRNSNVKFSSSANSASLQALFEESEDEREKEKRGESKREEKKLAEKNKRRKSDESEQDIRKKRKKRENREESEEESGREDEHDGTERPSTSTRSSGKTHRDLYEERKKKSLRRKIESSKQRRNVAQDARKKRHAVKGVRSDMRETRCSSVDSEASSIDGGDDRFFFTSRPRNASRDGSVVPSVGGSRSGSREGSVAGSREGSPERDYVAHHAIDPGALAEKMRNDEKLKNRLIIEKMKEEDERERLRIEREKEKARKQKATGNPTPINPDEKIRAKPKVAMRSGRDPGILDGPASLHSVNRSVPLKTKGGTARKGPLPRPIQMGKRPSTQSLDPLDAIQIEMNQPLPSAPTISGKPISATPTPTTTTSTSTTPTPTPTVTARINYVNPTQDRMYAPDSDGVREERMTRRIEYGRANVIEEPLPIHNKRLDDGPSSSRRSSSSIPVDRVDSVESVQIIQSPPDIDPFDPMETPSSIPSPSRSQSRLSGNGGGGGGDDTANDHPQSPYHMDAPASPDPVTNGGNEEEDIIVVSDEEEDVIPLPFRIPYNLDEMSSEERERFHEKSRDADEILNCINDHILEGETAEILGALNWKFEKLHVSHFDDPVNREFIYELMDSIPCPSLSLFATLALIIKWDSGNLDWETRLTQSRIKEGFLHARSSVTFAVLPTFVENRDGTILLKKTPLSEAVEKNKFEWIQFLIKEGAHINEKVVYHDFTGYIVVRAIERISKAEMSFPILRLLLSYGANRQSALSALEAMKKETIIQRVNGITQDNFDVKVPFYQQMHLLFSLASRCISSIFKSVLLRMPEIANECDVSWVKETVSSLPYFTTLVVEFEEHYRTAKKESHPPFFAVVVGLSKYSAMKKNEMDPANYQNVQVEEKEMELMHSRDRVPPFILFPCAKLKQGEVEEPEWNWIELESLYDDRSIFIIPPQLYPHLKSFTILAEQSEVHHHRIVFGGLVRLNVKGEMNEWKMKQVVDRLRGARGGQFDQWIAYD